MYRFIPFGMLLLCVSAVAQEPRIGGPGKPLSPGEAAKQFRLPSGLRIELVACEPQVESPVAMAFAPDGKLWVVEMRDYPNGPAPGNKPIVRAKVFGTEFLLSLSVSL